MTDNRAIHDALDKAHGMMEEAARIACRAQAPNLVYQLVSAQRRISGLHRHVDWQTKD